MCVLEDNSADLQSFLEKGADPNFVDEEGFTALYSAVKYDSLDCAIVLLQWGARIAQSTDTNESPIELAVKSGQTEFVDLFLDVLHGMEEKNALSVSNRLSKENAPARSGSGSEDHDDDDEDGGASKGDEQERQPPTNRRGRKRKAR